MALAGFDLAAAALEVLAGLVFARLGVPGAGFPADAVAALVGFALALLGDAGAGEVAALDAARVLARRALGRWGRVLESPARIPAPLLVALGLRAGESLIRAQSWRKRAPRARSSAKFLDRSRNL
jgi:hypothetical protein